MPHNFVYFVSQFQYSQFYRENASEVFRLASQLETNKDQLDALKRHSVRFCKPSLHFFRVSFYRQFFSERKYSKKWSWTFCWSRCTFVKVVKRIAYPLFRNSLKRLQKVITESWNHFFFEKVSCKIILCDRLSTTTLKTVVEMHPHKRNPFLPCATFSWKKSFYYKIR